jgi:hypothetical protein
MNEARSACRVNSLTFPPVGRDAVSRHGQLPVGRTEAEFLDVIGTKVFRVFLLAATGL